MGIPQLSEKEKEECKLLAENSPRRRYGKILHKPGDEFNQAFNFLLSDTYMQPHHHPSNEKIEKIRIMEGKIAVLFFDDGGEAIKSAILEKNGETEINVPAFSWHTYVVLSDYAITYETMIGVYNPATWKEFAKWAPPENTPESEKYLNFLKEKAVKKA